MKPVQAIEATDAREVRESSLPYVLPFAVFIAFLAVADYITVLGRWEFPVRVAALAAVLILFSRRVIDFRTKLPVQSILLGLAVFAIWIAPDTLFPQWRQHWLFQNSLTGGLKSSIPTDLLNDGLVLFFRTIRAVVLVPIIEELFWRAWLMRWIIDPDFSKIPLGAYAARAFWITAILFASEHGPYWEVGLVTGVLYNWWMVKTRSLGDLILTHAVTNGALCAFVVTTRRWEYWL